MARNCDARFFKKIDGEREITNFLIFYELDQQTVKTALLLEDFGGEDEDGSWVFLEECNLGGGEGGGEGADEAGGEAVEAVAGA